MNVKPVCICVATTTTKNKKQNICFTNFCILLILNQCMLYKLEGTKLMKTLNFHNFNPGHNILKLYSVLVQV